MALQIIAASERRVAEREKNSIAIFGPPGVGKTSLLHTLPADTTLCVDLEAGLKSVQSWEGCSLPIRSFGDFQDLAVLIAGPDPAASPNAWFSQGHFDHAQFTYAGTGLVEMLRSKSIIFVDSITELTRKAMVYAAQRPEAMSERTGRPDTRSAYGLLAREVILSLKHLQHAAGKTVIFVGVLEKTKDDTAGIEYRPQMEGAKTGRELPGIVDEVFTMQWFSRDASGVAYFNEAGNERLLVCKEGNPWSLPAKDRSGQLDLTEVPDLSAILAKINRATAH